MLSVKTTPVLSMLGWQHDLGFIIRVHGQEFNSYQRRFRGKRLHDFHLRRQENLGIFA